MREVRKSSKWGVWSEEMSNERSKNKEQMGGVEYETE